VKGLAGVVVEQTKSKDMLTMDVSSELTLSSEKHLLLVHRTSVIATYIGDCIVHLQVPSELLSEAIVPGVARDADVEIVVMKDQATFTNHLHLLGSSWLADVLNTESNFWLLELIKDSALMSTWDRESIWVAVPLERKNKLEYCMPMADPNSNRVPLLNCKTAIIADQYAGITDSTLAHCSNSIGFLMGKCKLGCALCSIGLGSAAAK